MPDPFEQLRLPPEAVAPRRAFALRLRARLAAAMGVPAPAAAERTGVEPIAARPAGVEPIAARPQEVSMTVTDRQPATAVALTPYLAVGDAPAALAFYATAFGARTAGEPIVMPDGRIGHAELTVGGGRLMLSDEAPAIGVAAPQPGEGARVTLHLEVPDVDAAMDRALAAGAVVDRPAADHPYGRNAVVRDPFGHRWMLSGPVRAASGSSGAAGAGRPRLRHGDIAYASLWVPDPDRAAAFFAEVLGWQVGPTPTPGGSRQVAGLATSQGLARTDGPATLFCCYAVDDVVAAAEQVRAAGGHAGAPERRPYGDVVDCTDDQGVPFAVVAVPGGVAPAGSPPPATPGRGGPGDLVYVTMYVADSARARAFAGSVLGWRAAPGRVPDGWQVEDVFPMVGLAGGHEQPVTVPMYEVADVERAVATVRRLGGTATDPERQPYGVSATCTDDQGTRFFLLQGS